MSEEHDLEDEMLDEITFDDEPQLQKPQAPPTYMVTVEALESNTHESAVVRGHLLNEHGVPQRPVMVKVDDPNQINS